MAKAKYTKNSRGYFETKIWDGTFNEDGSKHRKLLRSSKSSADLERQVNELKNQVANGQYVAHTDVLFVEYANHWLLLKKSPRELNTRKMYRNIIDTHLSFLEAVRLCDIRNSHFQLAINNAIEKPRTCEQIYLTFKQIINQAVIDNHIGAGMRDLIFADINLPKRQKSEKRPLTEIEKKALHVAEFDSKDKAFVYLIYSCGIRRGEALALSKFDFKFSKGKNTLSINKNLIFDGNNPIIKDIPKTENGIRTIPVPDFAAEYLKLYISSLSGTYLFPSRYSALTTHSSYCKMWERIVREINHAAGGTDAFPVVSDLTAHIFRHNYCTELCYRVPEISIKKIAYLMGDTEKMVLDVYNHIVEEKEKVDELVNDLFVI